MSTPILVTGTYEGLPYSLRDTPVNAWPNDQTRFLLQRGSTYRLQCGTFLRACSGLRHGPTESRRPEVVTGLRIAGDQDRIDHSEHRLRAKSRRAARFRRRDHGMTCEVASS